MPTQEALTFLFDAIALSFIAIASLDFGRRVIALYKQVFTTQKQLPSINSQSQVLPQLPDPWLLPVEMAARASTILDWGIQSQPKPVLLLAPAKAVSEVRLPVSKQALASPKSLEALLLGVDLDALKLRPARRIAKALGIAQKINGKDQKLSGLRAQIQASLQQDISLQPETVAVISSQVELNLKRSRV